MKPDLSGAPKKRSRWWPFNLRWVQVVIIVAILVYTVNYIVAAFLGPQ
ncbi:MAG TPA: hypothetical protein VNU19_09100 [Candidatus Acidoferrum sp.]|jgi:hypothetical protein|nr:hypothetical protein [Candidatus Acidoferrum sp.]